jgi:serine/threonine-protein kinase SRK2
VGGELYELVSQLGVGDTGVTKLMRDRRTGELVATKWVPHMAGEMLSVKVEREILNHRKLLHPNVVRFREVQRNLFKRDAGIFLSGTSI